MKVPFTISDTFPEASLNAPAPANTANTAYENIEKATAIFVPLGIALAASLRSPQILAPA